MLALAVLLSVAQTVDAKVSRPPLLTAQVVQAPDPMVAFGKAYVVYELLVTSYDSHPVKMISLRVRGAENRHNDFRFSGGDLAKIINSIGTDSGTESTTIGSGQSRIVYIWLPFPTPADVPQRITQTLECERTSEHGEVYKIVLPSVRVGDAPSLSIGPPLRGDDWIAEGGPSNSSYHRRARMAANGNLYFAQRFAIDYVKVTADGHTYTGDRKKNSSYLCHGADVLAVADGKVVAVKNDIPENIPDPTARAVEIGMATAGGNYVALDLGYHRYALYGHLIPGSITVKVGDSVKRGTVLGHVGNSGNSTEPHLHFQIADAPSFLAATGLPYVYEQADVKPARIVDALSDPPVIVPDGPARRYLATMLLDNDLVDFPK
jgi:Peptidase family M23